MTTGPLLAITAEGVATAVVTSGAVVASLGVIARTPPARWLWRTVVAEPVMAAFRREVGEVVDERLNARPLTNGWGTEAIRRIAEATDADVPPPQHTEREHPEG